MPPLLLALDTCMLVALDDYKGNAADSGHVGVELAGILLRAFRTRSCELLVDSEGYIFGEYRRHVMSTLTGNVVLDCANRYQVVNFRGQKLSTTVNGRLDRIGFDPADRPFLNVCNGVEGRYVTSEEKHLEPERRAQILDICGVQVISIEELYLELR